MTVQLSLYLNTLPIYLHGLHLIESFMQPYLIRLVVINNKWKIIFLEVSSEKLTKNTEYFIIIYGISKTDSHPT